MTITNTSLTKLKFASRIFFHFITIHRNKFRRNKIKNLNEDNSSIFKHTRHTMMDQCKKICPRSRIYFIETYLASPEYLLNRGLPDKNAFSAISAKLNEGTFSRWHNICEHLTWKHEIIIKFLKSTTGFA